MEKVPGAVLPAAGAVESLSTHARAAPQSGPAHGIVVVAEPGRLQVSCEGVGPVLCEVLDAAGGHWLSPGDQVVVLLQPGPRPRGIVIGRVSAYRHEAAPRHQEMKASESLTLRCGESSLEMRADGQVLLKGDDVLLRAKGTQRIRAGTVAIN